DGEDGKRRDFSRTVPAHLADVVIASAAEGRKSVLLFEDWQTADAAIATAAILNVRMPGAAAILWNANNTYGFGSVDFPLLRRAHPSARPFDRPRRPFDRSRDPRPRRRRCGEHRRHRLPRLLHPRADAPRVVPGR